MWIENAVVNIISLEESITSSRCSLRSYDLALPWSPISTDLEISNKIQSLAVVMIEQAQTKKLCAPSWRVCQEGQKDNQWLLLWQIYSCQHSYVPSPSPGITNSQTVRQAVWLLDLTYGSSGLRFPKSCNYCPSKISSWSALPHIYNTTTKKLLLLYFVQDLNSQFFYPS